MKARRSGPGNLVWWLRGPHLALVLLALIFAGGTLGYMVIEKWSVADAFYMMTITVTTVGYQEVHPLSPAGRAFTVLLLVTGVGTALYAVSLFASLLVEGGLDTRWEQFRRARMLENLTNHFIVCGYGRIGSVIVDEMQRQGVPYVVIERDPDRVHAIIERGGLAVEADASNEDVLRRVQIQKARGFIAAVGTDAENVYAVLSARLLRPDLFIIGRAETDDASRKLRRAGADRVISPYQIGALQMAQTALRPAVVDFVHLATSSANLELTMEQVEIKPAGQLGGKSIVESNLRQRYGVVVVAIQHSDGHMDFNPSPETVLRDGDQLVVLGRPDGLKELEMACQT